ncbi:MAG: site-specific DNA-methyltransferase [Candidatus Eisenbacteria bacterium]
MDTAPNVLLHAEFLQACESVERGSLALLYVDPPFGTGRAQRFRFGLGRVESPLQDGSNRGKWLECWIPRLERGIEALRPGGILVVHLDPRLAPFVRVSLEERLGPAAFLNEIVWHYRSGGVARDRFAWKHDTLLVWRNGPAHTFHAFREKRYLAHRANRRGVEEHRDRRGWYRYAWADDVWEIPFLPADSSERLGYPMQKPEALAVRLIEAFTDEGDRVADWTCGSGTLAAAAHRSRRAWTVADLDPRAVVCTAGRLVRILSPALATRWRAASVAERKADLSRRLARYRLHPDGWGLAEEERQAWQDAAPPAGFVIESGGIEKRIDGMRSDPAGTMPGPAAGATPRAADGTWTGEETLAPDPRE